MSTRPLLHLQELLGHRFQNADLLRQALVHRSYAHERPETAVGDNERLEFLGDAVLSLIISHMLLKTFPHADEGNLSRMRASLVNENRLATIAAQLGLGLLMRLGKGEEMSGGRAKPSILADAVEALLGAVYLDGGLDAAFRVVRRFFDEKLEQVAAEEDPLRRLDKDFKTQLQEVTQAKKRLVPQYDVEREEGPDHDKTFYVSVSLEGRVLARGKGKSKKAAEQNAAQKALAALEAGETDP
ncbi:ribonuclease III [Desulfosoma caldarium]|uniref:Ribonuclease 3 n=1 Tax=Desulfosoma caldarium TaxID=610254 RepID=A0A3N1VPE2_9BACT|nr:ribonuclease III [Desulfosoma caldarium]ROR01787.1 RNAse III [Desulfosoma caldarium]